MLRTVSILLMLFVTTIVAAQNYVVHKVSGNVINTKTNQVVKKNESVSLITELDIPKNGSIEILEKKTNRILSTDKEGKMSVSEIIGMTRKKSDKYIKEINSQIARAFNESDTQTGIRKRGVTVKGGDNAETLRVYDSLLKLVSDKESTNKKSDAIVLSALFRDSNSFYFSVTNISDVTLYINIVRVSTDGEMTLCLNFGDEEYEPYLCLNPGNEAQLEDFVFLRSDKSVQYILFATEIPFNSLTLEKMISEKKKISSDTKTIHLLTTTISL